jgi:hypothetical protein
MSTIEQKRDLRNPNSHLLHKIAAQQGYLMGFNNLSIAKKPFTFDNDEMVVDITYG